MALALALIAAGLPIVAQSDSETAPETSPYSFGFASYAGSGYYNIEGSQALILAFNPRIRLRNEEEKPFGVILRLGVTLGFYDVQTEDFFTFDLPGQVGTFTLLPGVEFPIKVAKNWTLGPFGDFGAAYNTDTGEATYVAGVGIRSWAYMRTKRVDYSLWNRFLYARDSGTDVTQGTAFIQFRTELDVRRVAVHEIYGRAFDFALYFQNDFYPQSLEIPRDVEDVLKIATRWQVGFTWGPLEMWRPWWKFTVPRLGISYILGDGSSGWRFILRYRYKF